MIQDVRAVQCLKGVWSPNSPVIEQLALRFWFEASGLATVATW
ncbi:MAG: hypothetical protein JWM11_7124 [Planctomycetaceae bacterium]|nr:hypothetical protein [Planctomycetaceae bacterium]